jgi:hypothetical protein
MSGSNQAEVVRAETDRRRAAASIRCENQRVTVSVAHLARFAEAVAEASTWTGLDWETGYSPEEDEQEAVEISATSAAEEGGMALVHLRAGYIGYARGNIERACAIESQYGDCPSWGGARQCLDDITAEIEGELSAQASREAAHILAHPAYSVLWDLLCLLERNGEVPAGLELGDEGGVEIDLCDESTTAQFARFGADENRRVRILAQEVLASLAGLT